MLLFSFHHHASCTLHFIHLHAVHGYVFFSSLPFCHCRAVASCPPSISWLCLMHAPNTCCHILSLCWNSLVDPIYTCTHIPGSIKGCKCQPGNSSLVLLIFPLLPVRSSPVLFASAYGLSLLWFPRVPSWHWYLWVVSPSRSWSTSIGLD